MAYPKLTLITDENPSWQTFWQYGLRFRVEEVFLDSNIWGFSIRKSDL